jgi:hypothetical protein
MYFFPSPHRPLECTSTVKRRYEGARRECKLRIKTRYEGAASEVMSVWGVWVLAGEEGGESGAGAAVEQRGRVHRARSRPRTR